MKTTISSQQLSFFRQQGRIGFENFPLDFAKVKHKEAGRDFWRSSPFLKKFILHTLGPLALELTKKRALRLACDQWIDAPLKTVRIQDSFCFQGLACVFVFSENKETGTTLDVFEPSTLATLLPIDSYLVAFALENGVLIENKQDPFNTITRNLGYVYGDRLNNPFHPIIHPK